MRFLRNVLIIFVLLVALLFLVNLLGGSDYLPFDYGGF
ncbi:hypothetical protein Pla86_37860 [Planctomycetes bacterium Pla86]|uniref:Uncharacterized protein n=1 Tax=Engelhardtia mirabilis TaxID=2528011 RepID=A0A518BNX8_9BACT|nr:hypothetical protein Pla133_37870 [Planctomycetes bacterium Pla133]QDV03011.1 hypothetical protein Pla86_37860 [Planctomycetes bacterium Pla86]